MVDLYFGKLNNLTMNTYKKTTELLLIVLFLEFVPNCNSKSRWPVLQQQQTASSHRDQLLIDTVFNIFHSKDYIASFKSLSSQEMEEQRGIFTLKYESENKSVILLNDTLDFFNQTIKLKDFNNDKVKDILIPCSSSARSNWSYHLYVTDSINHKLTRIKDFEELCNPVFDSLNNIITSICLSGTNQYSFYRINKSSALIDLGNSFEDDGNIKSNKYKTAIQRIIKGKK